MWSSLTHPLTSKTGHLEREHKWRVPDNGNLIAGDPTDLKEGSDIILRLKICFLYHIMWGEFTFIWVGVS